MITIINLIGTRVKPASIPTNDDNLYNTNKLLNKHKIKDPEAIEFARLIFYRWGYI